MKSNTTFIKVIQSFAVRGIIMMISLTASLFLLAGVKDILKLL
jgi:hypothetical protein